MRDIKIRNLRNAGCVISITNCTNKFVMCIPSKLGWIVIGRNGAMRTGRSMYSTQPAMYETLLAECEKCKENMPRTRVVLRFKKYRHFMPNGCCEKANIWCENKTPTEAWEQCSNPAWLAWWLRDNKCWRLSETEAYNVFLMILSAHRKNYTAAMQRCLEGYYNKGYAALHKIADFILEDEDPVEMRRTCGLIRAHINMDDHYIGD